MKTLQAVNVGPRQQQEPTCSDLSQGMKGAPGKSPFTSQGTAPGQAAEEKLHGLEQLLRTHVGPGPYLTGGERVGGGGGGSPCCCGRCAGCPCSPRTPARRPSPQKRAPRAAEAVTKGNGAFMQISSSGDELCAVMALQQQSSRLPPGLPDSRLCLDDFWSVSARSGGPAKHYPSDQAPYVWRFGSARSVAQAGPHIPDGHARPAPMMQCIRCQAA